MKRILLLAIFSIGLTTQALQALFIDNDGPTYTLDNVTWQNVMANDDATGFKAAFPGSPTSYIFGDSFLTYSKNENTEYRIFRSNINSVTANFLNEQDFLNNLEKQFEGQAHVCVIPSEKNSFRYIAEWAYFNGDKIARMYLSDTHTYLAIVSGNDFSLAYDFFNSIDIDKIDNE